MEQAGQLKIRRAKVKARKAEFRSKLLVFLLLVLVVFSTSEAGARPTSPGQAAQAVSTWLGLDAQPLGARLGHEIREIQTYPGPDGDPAYYVVYLHPSGLVFLPADDLVEPIIGFMPGGSYDPAPTNPLGALVSRDIPGRVLEARQAESRALEQGAHLAPQSPWIRSQHKWAWLLSPAASLEGLEAGLESISDERVAPLLKSKWDQANVNSKACYNYYTPPGPKSGKTSNYPCGCVATAMSQLMLKYSYPASPVVQTFSITVDGTPRSATIRGGNGKGGKYQWGKMVLDPKNSKLNSSRCKAIGALTYDAGVSVEMNYRAAANGGSYTDTLMAADAFKNVFHYSNAVKGYNAGINLPSSALYNMVNTNLDAGFPVLFGIYADDVGGHAIVGDGYGYNASTMYHHLNMGWSGDDNLWYSLPTIDSNPAFNVLYKCVYNVYISGTDEIIGGRVTDANGVPLPGVTVSATGGYASTTNEKGIYALTHVPSHTTFAVSASKSGYAFTTQSVATATSLDSSPTSGNRWDINFVALGGNPTPFTIKKIDYIDIGGKTYWLLGAYPDINDLGQVTFEGEIADLYQPGNIFLYFPNDVVAEISNNVSFATYPRIPIINNLGQVIWRETSEDSDSYYLYSGGPKTLMFGNSYSALNNSFSSAGFVWMDGNDNQVYLYNNGVTRINGDSTLNYPPCINDQGEVVWIGYPPGALFQEIYYYKNGQRQILNQGNTYRVIGGLQINNASQIFWFDLMTMTIRRYENGKASDVCTFTGSYISNLQINDLGEVAYVVGEKNLYCYKNGNTFKVYDSGSAIQHMQINNLGQIFWTVGGTIFYFDTNNGTQVMQFDNNYQAMEIKINNLGQVVWWDASAGKYGIYLASPQ